MLDSKTLLLSASVKEESFSWLKNKELKWLSFIESD